MTARGSNDIRKGVALGKVEEKSKPTLFRAEELDHQERIFS